MQRFQHAVRLLLWLAPMCRCKVMDLRPQTLHDVLFPDDAFIGKHLPEHGRCGRCESGGQQQCSDTRWGGGAPRAQDSTQELKLDSEFGTPGLDEMGFVDHQPAQEAVLRVLAQRLRQSA